MTSVTQVQALADAYRSAMLEGDQQLSDSRLERMFLHALVANSAADTARWVKTRLPDGAADPLESLVPALQEGDTIGKGLDAVKKQITDQVKALVNAAVFGATMPIWVGAVVGIVVGLFGLSFDAGAATGKAVLALVAGGGSVLYAAVRTISVAGPKAVEAVGGVAGSLWAWVGSLGDRAERLYRPAVGPALLAVYGGPTPSSGPTVTQQVRGSAKTVVWLAYALLVVAGLVFIAGMVHAFDAAASTPPPICSVVPTDPSC